MSLSQCTCKIIPLISKCCTITIKTHNGHVYCAIVCESVDDQQASLPVFCLFRCIAVLVFRAEGSHFFFKEKEFYDQLGTVDSYCLLNSYTPLLVNLAKLEASFSFQVQYSYKQIKLQ